jgi:hypothetical protein
MRRFPTIRQQVREQFGSAPADPGNDKIWLVYLFPTRIDAARMLKRRLTRRRLVGCIPSPFLRAKGITNFLENGGTLEVAQRMAGSRFR